MHLNAKCHEVALIVKLLITSVTWHTPQNRVSGGITHVTLTTIKKCIGKGPSYAHSALSIDFPSFIFMNLDSSTNVISNLITCPHWDKQPAQNNGRVSVLRDFFLACSKVQGCNCRTIHPMRLLVSRTRNANQF